MGLQLSPGIITFWPPALFMFCLPVLNNEPETVDQRSADMWSFAIILWELSTREVPFANLTPMEMGMKVCLWVALNTCALNVVSTYMWKGCWMFERSLQNILTIHLYVENVWYFFLVKFTPPSRPLNWPNCA